MNDVLPIHHDQVEHQFQITVDGYRAYLAYMDLGKQTLDFYRTFVPNEIRGRGVAAALAAAALDYADRIGYTVIPSCSYVESYVAKREEEQNAAS
jgi:predicted GNAT family acetyltransferase